MTDQFDMDRRALLQRMLLLVGATAIPAGCSLGNGSYNFV